MIRARKENCEVWSSLEMRLVFSLAVRKDDFLKKAAFEGKGQSVAGN